MNENNQDIRWIQRFDNYKKAFSLLKDVMENNHDITKLSDLEKEGVVKRFEFSLELAWKTLKDKMQNDGIIFSVISPKYVLKLAYQSKYIKNIDIWLKMINDRNLMSHTYNFSVFNEVVNAINNDYYRELEILYNYFINEQLD